MKTSKLKLLMKMLPALTGGALQSMPLLAPVIIKYLAKSEFKPSATQLATSVQGIDCEKEEILQRTNWVCEKVLVDPKELRNSYPAMLGDYYGPQWSIYSCAMLVATLSNISRLWPETKEKCLIRMRKAIELLMSEELKDYDTREYHEDPLENLKGNKSHMTYLSLLAWSLSLFIFSGGEDNRYTQLFQDICEALNRRMLRHKDLNLVSFPNRPIFFPDMLLTIVALRNYSRLYDDRYEDTVERWIALCKANWCHSKNGLINAMMYYGRRKDYIRGCYTALNNYWLTMIDMDFARDQYDRMKKYLYHSSKLTGVKEYLHKTPKLAFDPDAGPIIDGLSPSGTCYAIGSATFFEDWTFRNAMLVSAENAGGDVRGENTRHYKLGEFAIVGEASALAMRTHLPIPLYTQKGYHV